VVCGVWCDGVTGDGVTVNVEVNLRLIDAASVLCTSQPKI
jgi:hypothetical protein